jgi:hypothetical protein
MAEDEIVAEETAGAWTENDQALSEELDEIEEAARFEPHYALEEVMEELTLCRSERASLRDLGNISLP